MMQAPSSNIDTTASVINLVTVRLDRQRYALNVDRIVQIVAMVTITPLPHILGSVLGIINVRGAATPVIDLRKHMGMDGGKLGLYTPIVLTEIKGRMIGLVVDEVLDVLRITYQDIVPLNDIFPEGVTDLPVLHGMARIKDQLIPMLDADRLFHPEMLKSLVRTADKLSPQALAGKGANDMQKRTSFEASPVSEPAMPGNGNGKKTGGHRQQVVHQGSNGSSADVS